MIAHIDLLAADDWRDYELLDSGDGMRLERFGAYTLARPDPEVLWRKRLPESEWAKADATFHHGQGKERWITHRKGAVSAPTLPAQWPLHYGDLTFYARLTPFKHTGVFPEQAALWNWMGRQIAPLSLLRQAQDAGRGATWTKRRGEGLPRVLTLFGYTGLAALSCASAGATVTYVDASKWAMEWARANQAASQLDGKPIRWIVDDALKFVKREARRGARYDGIVMDPPSFGRGPKGEVWKFAESLLPLLDACVTLLSAEPLFICVTAYAVEISALTLGNMLRDAVGERGNVSVGELTLTEKSGGRRLSTAVVARWQLKES